MLEGLVAWVLNNYLGKYVENLNTDQLSVALLSGKVELENLPLKKDALRHLGLPVEVKSGFIGKVQLQVPVRQIRSAPWIIVIEKLYVVAAPVNLDEWDSEVEAHIAHDRKVALLDALEAQWRAEHEASDAGYYATSYSSWLSYGTGLLANIVENLQLKLNDVHIRYEDAITCAPRAFACGLTVEALTAESCDANWKRGFTLLADTDGCSFKLLELQTLAVYWDPVQVPGGMLAECAISDLTDRMSATWRGSHRYLVQPASARARVRRERTEQPLRSRARPRLACHLTLDCVTLDLTDVQYDGAVGCALGLERIARVREFRALRPRAPVHTHARLWWLYALSCHIPDHAWTEPKPTWESCLEQARKTKQYVDICLSILSNPAAALPPERKQIKDDFEWNTPLHILKPLREVAMRKVPKLTPASTPDKPGGSGRSMLVHWFPQWWGWYGAPADAPAPAPAQQAPQAPAPDLEEEILDVLADSIENNTLLKRDTVFGQFEFELNKGSLNLRTETEGDDSSESTGVELQFSAVRVRVESRPRAAAHALHLALGALCLRERVTPGTLYPVLIAPQGVIREGLSASSAGAAWARAPPAAPAHAHEPLFQLSYEKKPIGVNADYKLWVKSASLEVVYCAAAARWAQRFVGAPWGARPYAHVRSHTRATLTRHWATMMRAHPGERRSWQVELDISAPQILFVEGLCSREACVLVVDFGRLRLANHAEPVAAPEPPPQDGDVSPTELFMTPCSTPPGSLLSPGSPPAAPPHAPLDAANLHTSLYDRYKIELSDLQILVGRARDNWKYAHTKPTSTLHLLDRFSISLQAERRVVATNDPQYPTATLCGSLPALQVHLSEHKLAAVRAVLNAPLAGVRESSSTVRTGTTEEEEDSEVSEADQSSMSAHQNATLFLLQFAIEQMSLEVQSRGRSIAEVQVCGVRCSLAARPADVSLALSVHSLLLVDALQTYGPDFELLVASHKHLGMDTASGSILGSEPTSPTSPTSPASPDARGPPRPHPHPHALRHALDSLHRATSTEPNPFPDIERTTSPGPNWSAGSTWSIGSMFGTASGLGQTSAWGSTAPAWGSTAPAWGSATPVWGSAGPAWGSTGAGWGTAGPGWAAPGIVDSEALIAVELCFIKGEGDSEDLHIANILFNNLDIIANQETIVELIGFAQRVLGPAAAKKPSDAGLSPYAPSDVVDGATTPADLQDAEEEVKKSVRTEITFDFHRLGVLLLRAAVHDGTLVARKIATATIAEAKIQATLDASSIEVGGSLGGVQVVSLCEGAGVHSRVVSAGRLPPPAHAQPYAQPPHDDEKALFFTISRKVLPACDDDAPVVEAVVRVRVARVWYTQSGALLRELRSCLTEFKRYLADLARSIRAAAADMALGLVHPRGESLYANPKLSQSMEGVSPRRRTVSLGCSLDEPPEIRPERIVLSVSVELESPVVVLPRAANSTQVLVAHLGRMSLANKPGPPNRTTYRVRVRDISLATLDVAERLKSLSLTSENMSEIYDVSTGQPVLHNTALQVAVSYCEGDDVSPQCEVSGSVVGGLHVTARREQYEQVLDTARWLSQAHQGPHHPHQPHHPHLLADRNITYAQAVAGAGALLEPAVPTLQLDPALRAAALAAPPAPAHHTPTDSAHASPTPPHARERRRRTNLGVHLEVSRLSVELRADLGAGERSLVELAAREFALHYRAAHAHETTLQVSLHSITMEDLTKEPGSKHRLLMVSHQPQMPPKAVFVSKSCPDFVTEYPPDDASSVGSTHPLRASSSSLPSELNVIDKVLRRNKRDSKCGATPPCSPEVAPEEAEARASLAPEDNLVWVSVHTIDPQHPLFEEKYNKITKLTKVEFNCLNLVVSADSWVAVLDFFGVAGDDLPEDDVTTGPETQKNAASNTSSTSTHPEVGSTQTEISVRSLSVVVVRGADEWCRARVSRVWLASTTTNPPASLPASESATLPAPTPARELRGRLGALRLTDLSPRHALWRDRFRTHADHALTFHYQRLSSVAAEAAGYECSVQLDVGPATYVHTKRLVHEMHAIASDFSMLRRVILQARRKVSTSTGGEGRTSLRRLRVTCTSPVIVLPVSPRSRAALAVQLSVLHLDNRFQKSGDPGTVSTVPDDYTGDPEVLDVRSARLEGASLWCASAAAGGGSGSGSGSGRGLRVVKRGPPLLHAPAHLIFTIEQNITQRSRAVPDMTIQGTLTTLQCALEPAQYRLVRGVLAHNLGEALADLAPRAQALPPQEQVWVTSSLKLDLHDVTVRLEPEHGVSSLACVNFIKSRLLVETYSDLSQDIDLVSQEILVSDTRYANEPANRRGNVFSHIVQPMPEQRHSVQAEVHARKRGDSSAYTILVNNMRLMAILDWWEAVNQFIMQPPAPSADPDQARFDEAVAQSQQPSSPQTPDTARRRADSSAQMELKLNVTDSQLVLVEDASVWDTNAVILRSTTVITYRLSDPLKPVSCELNELEVFSCVLGLEEETALSIVDPCALHVALHADHVLHVAMGTLNLRLSYHDMRMFAAMLQSLPAQARAALSGKLVPSASSDDAPANSVHMRAGAAGGAGGAGGVLGAGAGAWGVCAPRWLRAPPAPPPPPPPPPDSSIWPLKAVQVNAECITLCVIDDCLDSDVPLLEVSLAELKVEQDLRKVEEGLEDPLLVSTPAGPPPAPATGSKARSGAAGGGRLAALLSADYYNRTLSGWEPVIEPWRFETTWENTLTSELSLGRVQVEVVSRDTLQANVTSALMDLVRLVRANWAADYYAPQTVNTSEQSPKGSPAGHRRRSPFVPYALRNHTGHRLWFTTLLTTADVLCESTSWSGPDDSWVPVRAGDTEPFSFGARRARARHHAHAHAHAHDAPATLHQLALRLDGWSPPDPVCVDRVGVYFRHIAHAKTGAMARIVLEVCLEGSARKLVTVRSALLLRNTLPHAVDVRVDYASPTESVGGSSVVRWWRSARPLPAGIAGPAPAPPPAPRALHPMFVNCAQWSGSGVRVATVGPGESWAAPLAANPGALWTRPVLRAPGSVGSVGAGSVGAGSVGAGSVGAAPAPAAIDWRASPAQRALLHYECRAPPDHVYRFCCSIIRERFPQERGPGIAGHTLTLVPSLRLENLLPLELHYRCATAPPAAAAGSGIAGGVAGALASGHTRPFHEVNVEEGVELCVKLEGFGWSSALSVCAGAAPGAFTARLKLRDARARRLYLNARVTHSPTDAVKVSVSAAYWLVNRTGLPLVFRAEGAASEAAGQGAEHEAARGVAPLLFSFASADGGPTLCARLGRGRAANPEWCSPFGLGPGVVVKRLTCRGGGVTESESAGASETDEREYTVGVSVRAGRGRYRHTNVVTLTPRYQLHNNSSHVLQFAQHCTATTLSDPGAMATHATAAPGSFLAWHWPRAQRPRLLSVRALDAAGAPLTAWSGGARVDEHRTLHLACRDCSGSAVGGGSSGYQFLRVEVVSEAASLFVVLTDADCAPPPIRIDNYAPVSIMFHQVGCSEESVVGAHGRLRWALPEPEGARAAVLRAPGGTRATLQLDALCAAPQRLFYQNFIYVAFSAAGRENTAKSAPESEDILVLEVPLGSTKVILGKKRYGDRSQLWRRGPNEQLIHEGSSPPQPTDALLTDEQTISPHAMVLDISEAAPRPGVASALVVRRADVRRASTQAWRVAHGRMGCAHANLCVRPAAPAQLVPGNSVVLTMPPAAPRTSPKVSWHTLRPGSGRLDVSLRAAGPTRLICVHDTHAPECDWIEESEDDIDSTPPGRRREWGVSVSLGGLGVSLVGRAPAAELVHAVFAGLALDLAIGENISAALAVSHMQFDNQLLGTPSPVLLYCLPERGGGGGGGGAVPALHAALEVVGGHQKRYNAVFFKHIVVALRPLAIRLEERLILQLWWWAAGSEEAGAAEGADEAEHEARRLLAHTAALRATRYYCGLIKLIPSQIRLSMMTASKLEGGLASLKRRLGLTLIKFEDACVELEPFVQAHAYDTAAHLARHALKHFKDELKWQAAKILGSVDFLGNPLGFVADVSEGVTGLLMEGNVGALLQNVTHGISNSAAKVTESLGDGLERVVSDEAHEETRRRIRSAAPGAHLAAGLRGLGLGILGGMTSLVKHSYEGAAAEGLPGFLAGVGKGLVGTVTKPVIGVLDLAAETASALRDTSRRSDKWVPARVRPPRCVAGAGGLLPRYCGAQAAGAALLFALNRNDYAERFLAYRIVRDRPHDIRALLSDTYLRIFTCKHGPPQVVMETHLSNLVSCASVTVDGAHYVELGVRGGGASAGAGSSAGAGAGAGAGEGVRRPRVQCDSRELAAWVARHAAYARQLYYEHVHTLLEHTDL